MILMTGATGKVGRQVVSQLTDRGVVVRQRPARICCAAGRRRCHPSEPGDPGSLASRLKRVEAVFQLWLFISPDVADLGPLVVKTIAQHVAASSICRLRLPLRGPTPPGQGSSASSRCPEQRGRFCSRSASQPTRSCRMGWPTRKRGGNYAYDARRTPYFWADQIRSGDVLRWTPERPGPSSTSATSPPSPCGRSPKTGMLAHRRSRIGCPARWGLPLIAF
jgi:hypothetical protein